MVKALHSARLEVISGGGEMARSIEVRFNGGTKYPLQATH
jgi:hypothetical protein